jgi:hypothetical protein
VYFYQLSIGNYCLLSHLVPLICAILFGLQQVGWVLNNCLRVVPTVHHGTGRLGYPDALFPSLYSYYMHLRHGRLSTFYSRVAKVRIHNRLYYGLMMKRCDNSISTHTIAFLQNDSTRLYPYPETMTMKERHHTCIYAYQTILLMRDTDATVTVPSVSLPRSYFGC